MMKQHKRVLLDFAFSAVILVTAFALNLVLLQWFSIPSVTPMTFVLGVFLIAWRTQGYFWGIVSSLASALVRAITAPFVAEYAASQDAPTCPHMEATLMIQPDCFCSIPGSTALTQ